jgi:parallel beta-helix repeat protein
LSNGMFTFKNSWATWTSTTDHWYVHDNRVYMFYRESGMQFNGDYNRIENNEIYKVTNTVATPYGCQMINILGNNNVINGNVLSRLGSTAQCIGILFEWDLADANIIEQNRIYDVSNGIQFQGGDNNIIRNNVIYGLGNQFQLGIQINSYDAQSNWPCDEAGGPLAPVNNPSHPDYQYYYNPRNCHSYGNQIYNNTIHGFVEGIRFYPVVGENTVIRNNAFSGWTRAAICHYNTNGTCNALPGTVTVSNNVSSGSFGFVNLATFDFHLAANSPLIDEGYNLGSLVPNDFDGHTRPQGAGFDVGAYEASQLSSLAPPTNLTVK